MAKLGALLIVSLVPALVVGLVAAQPPAHIQTAEEFLLGWGKGNWEAVKAQAGERVTVKVAGKEFALDVAGKKVEAQLILPFRGLATVRVEGKVRGVTVDEIAVKAGDAERRGKGTVTLEEAGGKFTVTTVAVE